MGFELRRSVDVLPFLRLNKTRKTTGRGGSEQERRRSWTWHVGPWRYDTRTGRHTFKLTKSVAYKSKPRGKVAAARVAKVRARHPDWTTKQVAERAGVSRATARRCIRRAKREREREMWDAAWRRHLYGEDARSGRSGTGSGQTGRRTGSRQSRTGGDSGTRRDGRSGGAGGRCGQPTADGTPCQRRGTCPPGTHTRTKTSA